ncbi:MAG: ATP-dependent helicase HrpB, partial [Xanthomonadales bacterium]|nr:ATP-dependent helicase HrpB [Xanthomonadales bacterium]
VLMPDVLALMESRSPLRGEAAFNDDFRQRLAALHAWRDGGAHGARQMTADTGKLAAIEQLARGWRQRLHLRDRASGVPGPHSIGNLLLHAFPDRVARMDTEHPLRYQLASGRGARLHENSALRGEPWLLAIDLRFDARDSLILAAAPMDPECLRRDYPQAFVERRVSRWNASRQAAEAHIEICYHAIVHERRKVPLRDADASAALLDAIRQCGLDTLAWSEATTQWRMRVLCLRAWCPELNLPDLSNNALLATLETWLLPFVTGKHRLGAISATDVSNALHALLDHPQRRAVDIEAPASLRVPSGREHAIAYQVDTAPVLAVKLQELFGLVDTPCIAHGKVPLTLHLLSPARRPIQVTQDLKSFWERTYPEVKKELKGRYPKHPWPDDPWTATPTARAKPRR